MCWEISLDKDMRHIIELFKTYLLIVGIAKEEVKEVYMGQVVQAACKQSPARQAALFAGKFSL